jgi:O-antigen/teichoic acid export membrane protein
VSLRQEAAKGITVVAVLKLLSTALHQGAAIVLAILLVPRDFGVVAIAMVFIALLQRFGDFGIGAEILQREERVEEALHTGATLRLLLAAALALLSFALAPWAAALYGEPAVADVMRVLSVLFLLSFAGFVSRVRLTRDLRFRKAVLPDTVGKATTSVVAIVLAFLGFGFWSLVHSLVLGQLVAVVLLYATMPWRLRFRLDRDLVRELLAFGRWIFLSGLVAFVFYALDNAVVGAVLGLAVLGYYLIAYTWAVTLPTRLNGLVDTVMFPVFSRMKGSRDRLRRAFLETTEYVAYVVFPLSVLVAVLAPDFVAEVLGTKWEPSVVPMQFLAPAGLLLALAAPAASALTALGRPRDVTMFTLLGAVLVVAGIVPAILWYGIAGLAVLVALSAAAMAVWIWRRVGIVLRLSPSALYGRFVRPLLSSVLAATAVAAFRTLLPSSLAVFLAEVALGTLVYLALMTLLTRGAFFRELRDFVLLAAG